MNEERKLLFEFLNSEIEERERTQERIGASPWLLMVSFATLGWLFFNLIGDPEDYRTSSIINGLILIGYARSLYVFGKYSINSIQSPRPGRFLYSNQIYKQQYPIYFLDTMRLSILIALLHITSDSVPLAVKFLLYTYATIGLILSLLAFVFFEKVNFPVFAKPRFAFHGKLTISIIITTMLGTLGSYAFNLIQQHAWPTHAEIKLIVIASALYYIFEIFVLIHQKNPRTELLKSYRQDLILYADSELAIRDKVEIEVLGYGLEELLKKELAQLKNSRAEVDEDLNLLSIHHSEYINGVNTINENHLHQRFNSESVIYNLKILKFKCVLMIERITTGLKNLQQHQSNLGNRIQFYVYQDKSLKESADQLLAQSQSWIRNLESRLSQIISESQRIPITDPQALKILSE